MDLVATTEAPLLLLERGRLRCALSAGQAVVGLDVGRFPPETPSDAAPSPPARPAVPPKSQPVSNNRFHLPSHEVDKALVTRHTALRARR